MRSACTALITCLLLASHPAIAGDVSDLLKKMSSADEHLNYEGVFVLRKSDKLMSMRVEHGRDDRGVWESLESLNGEDRKVIRVNDEVTSIYPERNLITVSRTKEKASLHPTLPENLDKLEAYYKISRLDDDRIANHNAAVLDVMPNDKFRYGYRYWLDTNTGVLLKCDLLNERSEVVEQMMFTTLEYLPEAPASAFTEIDVKGYDRQKLSKGRVAVSNAAWHVTGLPSGFMLTQSSIRKTDDTQSLHLMYSDGLASVSVFIEQGKKSHHQLDGASSMGALNAYGKRVGEHSVTVMGEVPASTVMQIAQSTKPVN
jgi:sigma-E factor negative regulatory protein RseB